MPRSKSPAPRKPDRLAPRKTAQAASPQAISPVLPQEGFIRERKMMPFVTLSRSQIAREVKAGRFPAPVKLSGRIKAWRVADVRAWIASKGAEAE